MTKETDSYQLNEQEHFDQLTETLGETYWGNKTAASIIRMRRRAKLAVRHLARLQDPTVLELGCGTGTFSKYILEEMPNLRLVGCDISPKAIEMAAILCKGFPNTRFEFADMTSQAYSPEQFEAMIGCSILHHLHPIDKVLAECFRVLKPGGIFWFTEPNMMHPAVAITKNVKFIKRMLKDTEDETAFFRWSMARLMRQVGFTEISVRPYDLIPPIFPKLLLAAMDSVGRVVENIIGVREIGGHLEIYGRRPVKPTSV